MKWLCCGKYCQNTAEDINSLDYSHSLLHEIPTEIYLFERTLEKLYLDSNRILELPKQLFNCDELRILNLSDNEISFLPPAVSLLINLQNLDISKNALTKIPENLRSCLCLSVLDLSINPLERFPESVISLVSLKELYLTDVCLEFLPANFGKLVNLRILELRENNLSTLPRTMSRLIHLTRLDIGNNEFTTLPEVISSFHNINELWIDGNHIKKLNRSIGQLRRMNHFEASNNKIASLPNEIGYWTKIVELSLSNNEITQLPSTIGNMKNLVSLKVDNNNLKALPNTLGKLVHLEELMINHNFISHLPASVGLLRKLQVLIADKNKLVSIPPELGSCSSLSIVSVQDNQISTMPAEIGHLCSLRVLNLVNNHLSYLPVSLLKLEKLAALWLSNNQSQPLVPLQQEISSDTHQMVLTCFMLPQISYKHVDYSQEKPYNSLNQAMEPNRRIYFANDISVLKEQPYKLLRAPTPYPKELRTLAKHAKNYQQGVNFFNKESQNISTMHNAVQIKEAKVAVTSNNIPTNETNLDCSRLWDKHVYISDEKVTSLSETIPVEASLISDDTSLEQNECSVERYALSLPILTRKSSPLIRKAKNIRTDIQNQCSSYETDNIKVPVNSFSTHNDFRINLNHTNILQLPTYRITAFNTQQSHYFNSLDYSHYMSLSCIDKKLTSSDVDYVIMQNSNACTDSNKLCELTNITNIQNSIHESEFYCSNKNNFTLPHSSNTKNSLENQTDYKLRTFIQDKPSPSQYIIAPTPKRPVGLKKSIIMPFLNETSNVKKSLLHLNNPVCQSTNKLNFQKHKRGNDSQKKLMSTNFNELQKVSVLTNKGKCVLATNTLINWAFGPHKNATVIQVTIQKSSELGFTISEKQGQGIFVESVASNGPARNILKAGDKILEVDGVDFREINENLAINILHSSSKFINMMISHMN